MAGLVSGVMTDVMRPARVLETGVYVDDLDAAAAFYEKVLGLERLSAEEGRHVFYRCGPGVFLVFKAGATAEAMADPEGGGTIPGHGTDGPSHMAFAVGPGEVERWVERLERHGVAIESRVVKPDGARGIGVLPPTVGEQYRAGDAGGVGRAGRAGGAAGGVRGDKRCAGGRGTLRVSR